MAVRPVDSLTMLPRLDQATRLLQQNDQHPYAFQHVLGSQMQEKAERERTQVRQKAEAEHGTVQREKQGKGQQQGAQEQSAQGQNNRQQVEQESTGQRPRPATRNGRLDVKV